VARIDQAEPAVQGLARHVMPEVAGDQGVGARADGRRHEVGSGSRHHRDAGEAARPVAGHPHVAGVERAGHARGQVRERRAGLRLSDPADQAGVSAPVEHVVARLLVGMRVDERRHHVGLACARRHELETQLGLAVERAPLASHRRGAASGEERARALGAERAVRVVADARRARRNGSVEHRVGGVLGNEGHELDRLTPVERREAARPREAQRLGQRVGRASRRHVEAGVHRGDGDPGARKAQRASPRIRPRDQATQGPEQQRVVGDQQVDGLAFEPRHHRLVHLVAHGGPAQRGRRVAELESDRIPRRSLGVGGPLRQSREQVAYGVQGRGAHCLRATRARRRRRPARLRRAAPSRT
jgi:hypothetical protein